MMLLAAALARRYDGWAITLRQIFPQEGRFYLPANALGWLSTGFSTEVFGIWNAVSLLRRKTVP